MGFNNAVEHEGSIDEHGKAHDLEAAELLPSEVQGNRPDEKSTAGIDRRSGRGTDSLGHGYTKKAEGRNTEQHNNRRNPNLGESRDLLPSSPEIKGRSGDRDTIREMEKGHRDKNGNGTKDTLITDGTKGRNMISGQDLLLDDKLGSSKDLSEKDQEDSENSFGGLNGLI